MVLYALHEQDPLFSQSWWLRRTSSELISFLEARSPQINSFDMCSNTSLKQVQAHWKHTEAFYHEPETSKLSLLK